MIARTRKEKILDAIVNSSSIDFVPVTREELFLAKILGMSVETPIPVLRIEQFYYAVISGVLPYITPVKRLERFVAAAAGADINLPIPLTREEFYWAQIVEQSGGIEKTVIGNPIHITDALAKPVQALSISLEPIQDLHGYDAPWPSGGGKNLLPNEGNNDTYITNVNVSYDSDNSVYTLNGTADGTGSIYLVSIQNTEMVLSTEENYTLSYTVVSGSITIPTGTGNTYAFGVFDSGYSKFIRGAVNLTESGVDGYKATGAGFNTTQNYNFLLQVFRSGITFNNLKIRAQLEKGSTATAWTPYSNECLIYGHTDADVVRTGKNLLDPTKVFDSSQDYQVLANGDIVILRSDGRAWSSLTAYPLPKGTYTLSRTKVIGWADVRLSTENYSVGHAMNDTMRSVTFTLSEDGFVKIKAGYNASPHPKTDQYQLELGSTATAYEEYRGTTYPIPLGTTVYGATVDTVNGEMTVKWAIVDLGTLVWGVNATSRFYNTTRISNFKLASTTAERVAGLLCSEYPFSTNLSYSDSQDDFSMLRGNGAYDVIIKDTRYSSVADFKTAMSGVQLCYELATPQTIQLTPQQVELLQGENNIWSDGTMTLVYLADGNASDVEALNILLGGRYVNNHGEDEPTDREALDILLGGNR